MLIIANKQAPVLREENLPVSPYLQVEVSQRQHGALLFILKHTGPPDLEPKKSQGQRGGACVWRTHTLKRPFV